MTFGWGGDPRGGWFGGSNGNGWKNVKGGSKLDDAIGLGLLGAVGIGGFTFLYRTFADGAQPEATNDPSIMQAIFDPIVTAVQFSVDLGLLGVGAYLGVKAWRQFSKSNVVCLRLKPLENTKVKRESVAEMVKEFRHMYAKFFWQKRVWIRYQIIRKLDGMFEFRLFVPQDHAATVFKRFGEAYPSVIIQQEEIQVPDFYHADRGEVAHMRLNAFPWQKERGLNPHLPSKMGSILNMMPNGTILEIMFSPSSLKRIEKRAKEVVQRLEERKKRGKDTTALIEKIRARYSGNRTAFDVHIDIWSLSPVGSLMGEISGKTEYYAKLRGRTYSDFLKEYRNAFNWDERFRSLAKWRQSRLTDLELAPFFMLPEPGHAIWQYIKQEVARPPVSWDDFKEGYGIGYIDSESPEHHGRIAYLKKDTYTNHGLIAGASGGGKGSAIMMLMRLGVLDRWARQEPDAMGVTICDPHMEDLLLIISHLLDMEDRGIEIPWEKVKVISFGKVGAEQYPVAANLLYLPQSSNDVIDRTAADVEEMILSAFDSSSLSQSVSYLKKGVQGILHMPGEHSLLDIVQMFEYSVDGTRLRESAIKALPEQNDVVRKWWMKTHTEIMKEKKDKKVNAIDTRLAPLLDAKNMQRFFLRKGNFFHDIPEWIKEGYLVLIDFKQAPDEMFRLAAAWLSRQYCEASQERGTGGRPHILIFDEVQKFDATEVFFKILTENRKFNCGLILATQDIESLDDKLKRAIKTNAGFVLSVRQGDGADQMAKLLGEPFTAQELQNLKKGREACIRSFNGKARLMLDYPYYPKNGQPTEHESDEEAAVKDRARAKFMELLARDHKPASEADKEIAAFVYKNAAEPSANNQEIKGTTRGQTRGTTRGQTRGQTRAEVQ